MMQIVEGYTGTDHVTAAMDGALNAGCFGGGMYVMGTGKRLACAVASSNSVTVADGDLMMNGRHGYIKHGTVETVQVASGTAGYRRNDVLACKYSKGSDGVESMQLVVVKGAQTTGTPKDPDIASASILDGASEALMPLWRLPLDGVSIGAPERLFAYAPTLSGLSGELSETRESLADTGVVKVYSNKDDSGSWEVRARRVGAVVEIWLDDYGFYGISVDGDGNATYRTLYPALPAQFRPKYEVNCPGSVLSDTLANANWKITSDGQIKLWASDTGIRYFLLHTTYLAAD